MKRGTALAWLVDVLSNAVDAVASLWSHAARALRRKDSWVGVALDRVGAGVAKVAEVLAAVAGTLRLRPLQRGLEALAGWLDGRMTGGLLPVVLLILLFAVDAVTRAYPIDRTREHDVTVIPLPPPRPSHEPPAPTARPRATPPVPAPRPAPELGDDAVQPRFQWVRADQTSFLGIGKTTYDATFALSRRELVARIDAYGVRKSELSYVVGEEAEHDARMRARGLRTNANAALEVDYAQVIADNRAFVRPLFESALARAREEGALSRRDLVAVLAGLVQDGLPYRIPDEVRANTGDDPITTAGFLVPVDALSQQPSEAKGGWGFGDCDTKSAVLAALLSHVAEMKVVMLVGLGHAFVGVSIEPESGDRYIERDGQRYVLIETTTPWPIGRIADQLWYSIGQFEVVQVV